MIAGANYCSLVFWCICIFDLISENILNIVSLVLNCHLNKEIWVPTSIIRLFYVLVIIVVAAAVCIHSH